MSPNIELKVNFWKELWEDLIEHFLKKSFGLNLYTPHVLIEDIILEIKENNFRNSDNKKYFYSQISKYIENDGIIKSHFITEFTLLRKAFNSEKTNYLLTICNKINLSFKKGIYFNESLRLVEELILNDKEINSEFVRDINYHSQSLIVEFVRKSYSLEDVKKFVENIFSTYRYFDSILTTNFPHDIEYVNFSTSEGEIDRNQYYESVKGYIEGLSIQQRIQHLSYYFSKEPKKVKYIFYIKGIKGSIEKEILGVHFYSLDKKRFLTEKAGNSFEDLQMHRDKKYIQVAVDIDYLMPKSSLKIARDKVELALSILSGYYNFKTDVSIEESNYLIINPNGDVITSTFGRGKNDSFMNYHDSFNINDHIGSVCKLNDYNFLWDNNLKSDSVDKLNNALHWYRKGQQSYRDADKLLNYWIAIENLFNSKEEIKSDIFSDNKKSKFHLIQEIISCDQVFKFIYEFGWELYHYFVEKADIFLGRSEIPEELINRGQLNPIGKTRVYLKNFIDILPELKNYEKNPFILEKIDSLIAFYSNPNYSKSKIFDHIEQVKNDVLMIYRFRNLIVHNAHFDNTLLSNYVWKTRAYCGSLIRNFISKYNTNLAINDLLLELFMEKEAFMLDLEKGKMNLFEN